jgi:hypothetical protein
LSQRPCLLVLSPQLAGDAHRVLCTVQPGDLRLELVTLALEALLLASCCNSRPANVLVQRPHALRLHHVLPLRLHERHLLLVVFLVPP